MRINVYTAVRRGAKTLRKLAPYDTGNLADKAITLHRTAYGYTLYVDPAIAPYMVYTEEPWEKPRGKKNPRMLKNPNEGWFRKAVEVIARQIANELKGELKIGNENSGGVDDPNVEQ
jgi:hypothetical protein